MCRQGENVSFKSNKIYKYIATLQHDGGSIAITWAISMMAVIFAVGATYDMAQITKAKQRAQMVADSMALTASIAVDAENGSRYKANKRYSYAELGSPGVDFTKSIVGYVVYDIVDDKDPNNKNKFAPDKSRLLARATVVGTYKPAFMSAFGYDGLQFTASSDVSYASREGTPATIFFAVDNSGSMGWTDAAGVQKLHGLENSLKGFMDILDTINTTDNDVYRTALWPYSQDYDRRSPYISDGGIITNKVVSPSWGSLSNGEITRMNTEGGTDSSGALSAAATAFTKEAAIHDAKNQEDDPIMFMVFMSDGANNPKEERVCETIRQWVGGQRAYWKKGKKIRYSRPKNTRKWQYFPATQGHYEDTEQCNWEDTYSSDELSAQACETMKSAGVTIYTIGYHLKAGRNSGHWVSQDEVDRAQALLANCASDADHYILAENANDLNETLAAIGEEIMKEVIRIKR